MLGTEPDWDTKRWHPWEREEKMKAATIRELDTLAPCMDSLEGGGGVAKTAWMARVTEPEASIYALKILAGGTRISCLLGTKMQPPV